MTMSKRDHAEKRRASIDASVAKLREMQAEIECRAANSEEQEIDRMNRDKRLRMEAYNAKEDIEGRPECRWRGAEKATGYGGPAGLGGLRARG